MRKGTRDKQRRGGREERGRDKEEDFGVKFCPRFRIVLD